MAAQIEHREWIVGNRCALGHLYLEVLAPEEAKRQFEAALTMARELQSQYWIHHATGALAGTYFLLDDWSQTQTLLEPVLSADMPMDSLAQRYCWIPRVQLALRQGDQALTLDLIERLIAAAPGMTPERVITFLWKLKAEALAGIGQMEKAQALLGAALESARATGERFLLWRVHASLGQLHSALGRESEAEKELTAARELVQEMADTLPAGKLRGDFLSRAGEILRPSP
jgi:tetratricopeptide (TPR) repeat protein